MSRILFFSDTHGTGCLEDIMVLENLYDLYVFLGDGVKEVEKLKPRLGEKLIILSGNCDSYNEYPNERLIEFEGIKIFATHGNAYGVRSGLNSIYYRALELQADIAVFGHTHRGEIYKLEDVTLMNVGSLSNRSSEIQYGVLEIIDKNFYPQLVIF